MNIKDKYAIVSVGYTPQGKIPERTSLSFHIEACADAINDAGLKPGDIDGLICYRHFPPSTGEQDVTPYLIAQHLGISPSYLSQEAYCSRSHLLHAIGAIASGTCNYVLLSYGHNASSGDSLLRGYPDTSGGEAVYGYSRASGGYALAARRGMYEFGTGPETWKNIAVDQRAWANLNPRAMMYKRRLNHEDYLSAPWVIEPFRLYDNCLVSDGGRACIITTVERAKNLKHPVVAIMGMGQHNPSFDLQNARYLAGNTGAKQAGEMAFSMAGIEKDSIDACQIYDCFTYTVEITLQDYGFFGPGEGRDWFSGGTIAPGGRMPVNTSGGQLSEAYQMGLTPLTEAVMQLMGRCGGRQLGPETGTKRPEIILCSDNGAVLQTHACYILRRI